MIPLDERLGVKATASYLVLAFIAAPLIATPQPESSRTSPEALQTILEQMENVQALHGRDSPELIAPLTALALWYEESGDDGLATAAIQTARHVVNVNYGLYSLEETPLMRQLIRIERTRGNVEAAWNLEQELLDLVGRHPGNLGAVPILREIAKARLEVVSRYQAGEFPREIALGCYYREPQPDGAPRTRTDSCGAGDNRAAVIAAISMEADEYLAAAERTRLGLGSLCVKPHRPESLERPETCERSKFVTKRLTEQYLNALRDYVDCLDAEDG